MFDTWCRWIFFLHKIVVYRHFSYFQYGFQNGRQRSRDYFHYFGSNESLYIGNILSKFHSNRSNSSGDNLCLTHIPSIFKSP